MTNVKQPWAMTDGEEFKAKMEQFCDEGGGVMRLFLVRYNDPGLLAAVKVGDPLAVTLVAAVSRALQALRADHLCLFCSRTFGPGHPPHGFVVWLPGGKTEEYTPHANMVTQPICPACCRMRKDREIVERSMNILKMLQLDVEVIEETEDYLDEQAHEG